MRACTRRRRDARVVETARTQDTLREVVIPRCSKHSSSGSAVTTEPRRSIMRARAASMAPRAASRVLCRWRRPRRCRCGFSPPGGRCAKFRPAAWHAWNVGAAASRAGRRRAPLYAIDATPHKFRQQPELRLAVPRPSSSTRPLRLRVRILQPRPVARRSERFRGRTRTHACFGWGSREARRPRARELFPYSPA